MTALFFRVVSSLARFQLDVQRLPVATATHLKVHFPMCRRLASPRPSEPRSHACPSDSSLRRVSKTNQVPGSSSLCSPPSVEPRGPERVSREAPLEKKKTKEKKQGCTRSRETRCKPQFRAKDFFYQMSELSSLLVSGTKVLFRWSSGFLPSVLL